MLKCTGPPRLFVIAVKTSSARNRTSRRFRAGMLVLSMAGVLAVATVPACIAGLCCPVSPNASSVHAEMPCCAGENSVAPSDVSPLKPATLNGGSSFAPPAWVAVAVVVPAADLPSRASIARPAASDAPHEPSPPLFLLNEQFLI